MASVWHVLCGGRASYTSVETEELLDGVSLEWKRGGYTHKLRRHGEMSDSERIMLSSVDKWSKYGRFPYKLILHSTMLMLAIIQVFSILNQFTVPVTSGEDIFAHYFIDMDSAVETERLFGIDDVLGRIRSIVDTYYNIDNKTIFSYNPVMDPETGEPMPVDMIVEYFPNYEIDPSLTVTEIFELTQENDLGPLNGTRMEAKNFLNHSAQITLSFRLNDNVSATQFGPAPLEWHIRLEFFNVAGVFEGSVWTTRNVQSSSFLYSLGWIPGLIITVSLVTLSLGIKAVVSTINVLRRTKMKWKAVPLEILVKAYKIVDPPGVIPIYLWSEIPATVKLDFFSSWNAMECVGEICLIIGCSVGFAFDHGLPVSDESRLFFGAGFMILCINFIKYLEYWKKFSVLVLTIQGSFLRNLRFVVSVFPLYMGFVVCGYIMFAPYSQYFATIDTTAVTLFALINGDDTHAIFGNLRENYPYPRIAQTYLFSFDLLFITLVLNVFLYIIEDAYQAASLWINKAGAKFSRAHRRLRADTPLPAGWRPPIGSVEFDIPIIFQVLDACDDLMLPKTYELLSDIDDNMEGPDDKIHTKPRATNRMDDDENDGFSAPTPSLKIPSLSMESPTLDKIKEALKTTAAPKDINIHTVEGMQAAIESAVARTHLQFVQQVEIKIKDMQDEYAKRLQREVRDIMQNSTALQQRLPSETAMENLE